MASMSDLLHARFGPEVPLSLQKGTGVSTLSKKLITSSSQGGVQYRNNFYTPKGEVTKVTKGDYYTMWRGKRVHARLEGGKLNCDVLNLVNIDCSSVVFFGAGEVLLLIYRQPGHRYMRFQYMRLDGHLYQLILKGTLLNNSPSACGRYVATMTSVYDLVSDASWDYAGKPKHMLRDGSLLFEEIIVDKDDMKKMRRYTLDREGVKRAVLCDRIALTATHAMIKHHNNDGDRVVENPVYDLYWSEVAVSRKRGVVEMLQQRLEAAQQDLQEEEDRAKRLRRT